MIISSTSIWRFHIVSILWWNLLSVHICCPPFPLESLICCSLLFYTHLIVITTGSSWVYWLFLFLTMGYFFLFCMFHNFCLNDEYQYKTVQTEETVFTAENGQASSSTSYQWGMREGRGWVNLFWNWAGFGFVTMIALSALPISNFSSVTFCLERGLVCQRVFLTGLTPLSALGFLCAPAPEALSILLPLPREANCCCFTC